MNDLPEDILYVIYKNVHSLTLVPELKQKLLVLQIESCIKEYPFVKTLSYISSKISIDISKLKSLIHENNNIYTVFNNLYNTTLYYHRDNFWLI